MPQLPTYNSQRNIEARPLQPLRDEASFPFQAEQVIVKTLSDITQKMSDARDVMQYTEAKAKYEVSVADIQARANADPDFNNSETYFKEMEEIKKISVSGIKNAQIRDKASFEFDYGNKITAIKIDSQFKKKELEHGQFVLDEGLDVLAKKKIMSSVTEASQIDLDIDTLINANIKAGIISESDGKKKREQLEKASIQFAINQDPDLAEEMLSRGEFQYLSPEDRVSFLKIIETAKAQKEEKIKKQYAEQKKEIENTLQDKFFNEDLSITDLEQAASIPESEGGPDRGLLDRYRNNLFSKYKDRIYKVNPITKEAEGLIVDNKKAEEYITSIDKVLDKETDLIKARKLLIDYFSDGKLNSTESKVLNKIIDMSKEIEIDKADGLDKGWLKLQGAWTRLKQMRFNTYKSEKSVEEQAEDLKSFIRGISDDKSDPNDILNTIIEQRQKKNYPEYQDWVIDTIYETPIGPVKVIGRDADGMPIVEIKGAR